MSQILPIVCGFLLVFGGTSSAFGIHKKYPTINDAVPSPRIVWAPCGGAGNIISIVRNPPCPDGEDPCKFFKETTYTITEIFEAGYAGTSINMITEVMFGGIWYTIGSKQVSETTAIGTQYTISEDITLASYTPTGNYQVRVRILNESNALQTCGQANIASV